METYITICTIDSQWEFALCLRKLKRALCQPRGVRWGGRWEGASKGKGLYVYLWLIYVRGLTKTAKFCKAVILQ